MVSRKNAHNVILELQTLVCPKLEKWKFTLGTVWAIDKEILMIQAMKNGALV
jgi:hypothetical protein